MPRLPRVRLTVSRVVAEIELSLAGRRSRIDAATATALRDAAATVAIDDSMRVVLLHARGADFCTGGPALPATAGRFVELRVAETVASLPQPVVAALQGDVFDQGFELALATDIRIAASDSRFAMRQVTGGNLPFDGGTQRLPRLAGRGLALDMLLTGRILTAPEALEAGLITRIVGPERLLQSARSVAAAIAGRGRTAGRFAKEAVLRGTEMPFDDALRLEADLSLLLFGDPERAEGLAAFREKRRPRFAT
jgi:enoyl-CoA hydratase/carnithine racemase